MHNADVVLQYSEPRMMELRFAILALVSNNFAHGQTVTLLEFRAVTLWSLWLRQGKLLFDSKFDLLVALQYQHLESSFCRTNNEFTQIR